MEKNKEAKRMGKTGIAHRRFSKEEKLKIVKEHLEKHESIKAWCRFFNYVNLPFSTSISSDA